MDPRHVYPGTPVTMTIKARVIDPAERLLPRAFQPRTRPIQTLRTTRPADGDAGPRRRRSFAVASQSVATINGTVTTVTVKNTGPGTRNLVVMETILTGMTIRPMGPDHRSFDVKTMT